MADQLKQLSIRTTLRERLREVFAGKLAKIPWPHRILHEDEECVENLETQLTEAQAREAVAYEVAVSAIDKYLMACTLLPVLQVMDIKKMVGNLTPDHTTTALEQIKQEARDEVKREFEADLKKVATILRNRQPDKMPDGLHIVNAILATLSDTPTT